MIQSRAFERKRLTKVLLLQAEKVKAPEQGMRRVEGEFLCFFLDIFLDRELGKVRSEFHHVAVGREKNKDDRAASPSLDFVGMMHHDAASCYGNGCGLAHIQNSRHVCFGWHQASTELMCRSRVPIVRLNVRLEPGTSSALVCRGQSKVLNKATARSRC